MSMLSVENLHVSYGSVEAVKGVSFDIERGEIVALLGSNGAGKTTTLKTIAGLQRRRSGSIRFDGRDLRNTETHQIVALGLGMVAEGRRLFGVLTVEENLNLGGYLVRSQGDVMRTRKERVYEVFPRLLERRDQLAGTLSGGEQQMLAIGRALMSTPKLLMLDEPSLGLSPLLSKVILSIVRQLAKEGTTILLVEQNARQALAIADRGYIIETGNIVLSGPARTLAQDLKVQQAYLGGFDELSTAKTQ